MKHLVLLHGWAGHSGMWGDFAIQLSQHYRVTLIDLPWRDDLKAVSDAIVAELDDEPFYLVGWSLGGKVALDIAARYTNRVQGLILITTNPHFIATKNWSGMALETFNAFSEQLHANPTATLQRFLALQLQGSSTFLKEVKARFATKSPPELSDLEASLTLLKNSDLRPNLEKLDCPIMVILSDNDAIVPVEIADQMQRLKPDLHRTILKNAGHIPFITQPENCLNAIHFFLNSSYPKAVEGFLDKTKIKQSFSNASKTYDSVADLQRNVGHDLLQAFLPKNLTGNIVDLGCGTGFLTQKLLPHCENLIALDLALPMLKTTREKLGNSVNYICTDAESLPLSMKSIDTIFSNLALQWCLPIDKALTELHQVLKADGELIFSTFGSKTLCELKNAWASVDNFSHVNAFYNASQLRLALEKAGFVNIEIKNQSYVSYYDSVLDLMRELKGIGAHNVSSRRNRNLTSKQSLKSMMAHYPLSKFGEVFATFEVIYVKAYKCI